MNARTALAIAFTGPVLAPIVVTQYGAAGIVLSAVTVAIGIALFPERS